MKSFFKLYLLNLFFSSIAVFGLGLIYFYLFSLNFSLVEISIYFTLIWVFCVIGILSLKTIDYSKSIKTSLMLRIAHFIILASLTTVYMLYFSAALFGYLIILFWVPFNAFYFSLGGNKQRMLINSLLVILVPLISIPLLPTAGFMAKEYGFPMVFALAAGLSFITFVFVDIHFPTKKIKNDLKKSMRELKNVRILYILEGFLEGIVWIVIPVVTLQFIKEEVAYGGFLSFLVIFAILGSVLISYLSDKIKNRILLAVPLMILTSIFVFMAGISQGFEQWTLFNVIIVFLMTMIGPFLLSLVNDTSVNIPRAIVARELLLSSGRIVGGMFVILFAFLGNIQPALMIAAVVFLAFPYYMKKNLKKLKMYNYSKL